MGSPAEIDVVIVNWNAGRTIADCIASLDAVAAELPGIHLIVVDNASSDGSADNLTAVNMPLTVIRNPVNFGFAGGCNQGVAAGSAGIVLFLNPDVIVFGADSIRVPLAFVKNAANREFGPCGIQLRDENGEIARTLSPFPTPRRCFGWMTGLDRMLPGYFDPHFRPREAHLQSTLADSIMGAFLMIRRSIFEELGGFSESFFVYYEDVDLCRRALYAGYKSWFIADVSVLHEGCGTTRNIKATRYFYSTRSRIVYGLRHFSGLSRLLTAAGWMLLDPLVRIFFFLGKRSPRGAAETIRGAGMLWSNARAFLREPRLSEVGGTHTRIR